MLWIMIITISIISLIPCLFSIYGKKAFFPSRALTLQLYHSQLKALDRELDQALILPETYEQTKLEIQRRILNYDQGKLPTDIDPSLSSKSGLFFILCGLGCIPLAAIGLYLVNGMPALSPQPLQSRFIEQNRQNQQLAPYIQQLKDKIASLNPQDPKRIEGYLLLGRIEAQQNHIHEAIQAWKAALTLHYDPTLAAQIAEMMIEKNGQITQESYMLFQKALKTAPANAVWRSLAEQRIIEYQKNHP